MSQCILIVHETFGNTSLKSGHCFLGSLKKLFKLELREYRILPKVYDVIPNVVL